MRTTILFHIWFLNDDQSAGFFNEMDRELNRVGAQLVLLGSEKKNPLLTVKYIQFSLPYVAGIESYLTERRELGAEFLGELGRHEEQIMPGETKISAADIRGRRERLYSIYEALVREIKPKLVCVWNGYNSIAQVLMEVARLANCPVVFAERGPFKGSIHIDERGILGNSNAATRTFAESQELLLGQEEIWTQSLDQLSKQLCRSGATNWEQPSNMGSTELRRQLGIPSTAKVVLFAGQVDADTQRYLFADHFSSNLEAFRFFLAALPHSDELYVLGKHHPKAGSPKPFITAIKGRGRWVTEASLSDCLALADYVAAVNSTVLQEALLHGIPCLSLGKMLPSRKGILYEIQDADLANAKATVACWLAKEDLANRLARWRVFAASLLARDLYFVPGVGEGTITNGGRELAMRLAPIAGDALPQWEDVRRRFTMEDAISEIFLLERCIYRHNPHNPRIGSLIRQILLRLRMSVKNRVFALIER